MKESSLTSVFNNRGFTLLEILIAITLLAFISIGVISVTQNAFDTKDRTSEANKNNLQIETAMARFEWDFSQLYSPLFFSTRYRPMNNQNAGNNNRNSDNGQDPNANNSGIVDPAQQEYAQLLNNRYERNEHFIHVSQEGIPIPRFYSPEKNVFEFFTSSNRRKVENSKQSHFAWVRYALITPESDPEIENTLIPKGLKNFVRYYTADDPYNEKRINPDDDKIKAVALLENVESLEFQFWDYARKKWETNLGVIQNGESLIRGIKILITWYDSAGFKRSTERIFRNHWPIFTPDEVNTLNQNRSTNTGGINSGANNGTNSGNNNSDQPDGVQ